MRSAGRGLPATRQPGRTNGLPQWNAIGISPSLLFPRIAMCCWSAVSYTHLFHEKVLGVPSRNLDLFLQGEDGVRRTLLKQKGDYVVVEGAMGFYDGVNGTDRASAWQVARTASLPVVLAIRPGGSSLTLAAQVKGLLTLDVYKRQLLLL